MRVGKAPPFEGCRELGIVMGSGGGGAYTGSKDKLESAMNELRNSTAEKGGDFVVMDSSAGDINGITMSGRAFDCSHAPRRQPVAVQVVGSAAPAPSASPEDRLRRLDDLRDKGLITPEEYAKRRQEILHDL